MTESDRISGIPLPGKGVTGPGTLALAPFRQIRERGLECHDDATPLQVLEVERAHRIDTDELPAALPDAPVALSGAGSDLDDDAYAAVVDRIVRNEIARGTGANFVIRRDLTARLEDYSDPYSEAAETRAELAGRTGRAGQPGPARGGGRAGRAAGAAVVTARPQVPGRPAREPRPLLTEARGRDEAAGPGGGRARGTASW
ncbi:hypothetical protein [Streptomyces sp. NBC_01767]|uniref:hypothetical protein n=1 Tax=Streptomyces sp. NBC_01767 TaxID=2975937 RepID=UPI002257F7BE|nr:hypothetical protein [Streptomyces sp. NBC_01767]MCX4399288.1 hypothetical protein [Streptomyces sp. NBC_01767]